MISDILSNSDIRMKKTVESIKRELTAVRSGKANVSLIENILVDYYDTPTPLCHLATITAPEARMLVIQPWDKQALSPIEKSILKSDVGLNPMSDGAVLRLPIPPLTEESRRDLVRILRKKIEDGRVSVRNIRRGSLEEIRDETRRGDISQDESRRGQDQLQKLTDSHISLLEVLLTDKETEIMQV